MKVIVDTCVWSLSLRRRSAVQTSAQERHTLALLREAIRDDRATIVGPIRQEVLSGIRDPGQFAKIEGLLAPFLDEEILPRDYVEAARLFNLCQNHGVQCGAVDILICAVAVRLCYGVLTVDAGLTRCLAVLQGEMLLP